MNVEKSGSVHWSFWAIAVVTLIWNGMGVMNYFMQMNADLIASFPESHRAIIESRPAWATGGFAVAVFGGTLGCILLLLKKSAAYYVFIVSLLGVMVTMSHALGISILIFDFSLFEMFMMILMPMVVAVFLIWYSKWAERKGWIS